MVHYLTSSVTQVLLFSFIPFLVYLIQKKKLKGFFSYIGLKRSNRKANQFALFIALLIAFPLLMLAKYHDGFREAMLHPSSVSGSIRLIGDNTLMMVAILFTAVFKTALAEEIFFRGFVAKRLIALLGFTAGNIVQAIIFGALHSVLFYFIGISDNIFFLSIFFIVPTFGAWFKAFINEKMANGSIIPGWIAHGTANVISYSYIAFYV